MQNSVSFESDFRSCEPSGGIKHEFRSLSLRETICLVRSIVQLERGKQAVSPSVQERKNKVQNSHNSSSSHLKPRVHHSYCLVIGSTGFRGLERQEQQMACCSATENEDNKC